MDKAELRLLGLMDTSCGTFQALRLVTFPALGAECSSSHLAEMQFLSCLSRSYLVHIYFSFSPFL